MQRFELLRDYCQAKAGATAERPFGPSPLVFKVGGKLFALIGDDEDPLHLILKCDPDEALFLRDMYTAVTPGYHMNKKHWNSIQLDGSLPDDLIRQLIDSSYDLVVAGLTKRQQAELKSVNRKP
jgi:predicted DNA-binding protein (MmcQ/YjbR family)